VQFTHPLFQDGVQKVLAACQQHGKAAGFMCADVADGRSLLARGFRILAYSGDLWLYQQALRAGLEALRSR
jgi:2-dehydro-3-deoxyglucarate aldolase/4-hydroxy-2-oxoheptanedioate aldolase